MALNRREQNLGAFISFWAIALFLVYLCFAIVGFQNEIALLSTLGIVIISSICFCLLVLRKYRKEGNAIIIDYFNIGTHRYVLAMFMVLYGVDKLVGNFFDYQLFAMDSKLAEVSEFQLAWYFYGQNKWQELFTGIMEFVPALFLLHRRSYYIAAIILLPVTAQVFLLNSFFKIGGITFPASTILLACNAYILYSQKEKIILFFKSLDLNIINRDTLNDQTKTVVRILKGICYLLVVIFIFIKTKSIFFKSSHQRVYQSLVGAYTLKEIKKNGVEYIPHSGDTLRYQDIYIEKQNRWNILTRLDGKKEAFILKINTHNDSIGVYINKGGIGDNPDIIDSVTALKGVYKLEGKHLTIKAVQLKDTLQLIYEKQDRLKAKTWFW